GRVETEKRPVAMTPSPPAPLPQSRERGAKCDWLVSPAFDLLFLANLGWLLALVPGYVAAEGTVHIEFWQIYFLTTPHRWITLLLVAADPDRRAGRGRVFVGLAALSGLLVAGVCAPLGGVLGLLAVDLRG